MELPGLASPALLGFSTPPSWGSQLTARPGSGSLQPPLQLQPPLWVAGIAGLGWIIQNNSSLAGSPWGRGKLTFQTLVFLSNFPEFLGLGTSGQSSGLPNSTAGCETRCPRLRSLPAHFSVFSSNFNKVWHIPQNTSYARPTLIGTSPSDQRARRTLRTGRPAFRWYSLCTRVASGCGIRLTAPTLKVCVWAVWEVQL